MEKFQRIEPIRGKIQLPVEAIERIQSLLSEKEAAQTTMISKSWYAAWLTHPNLDFSHRQIPTPTAFVEYVKNTLQRYEESKITIQSFRLYLDAYRTTNVSTAKELILKAMKLGVTDLDINGGWFYNFPLPGEVFKSETLVRLSMRNCEINMQDLKVCCMRLKYLNLRGVRFEGIALWDIISMCPLIEELVLSDSVSAEHRMLVLEPGLALGVCDFRKLKVLFLKEVEIGLCFYDDFSSRFPCLEDFSINDCNVCEEIQICSNSLECISITEQICKLCAEFDVPRIRKFVYSGSCVPSLCFKTIPSELEFDITIRLSSPLPKTPWLLELREFLLELSPSKTSLCLDNISYCYYDNLDVIGLPKPPIAVENLKLLMDVPSSLHHALLDGIFRCCHPSFVNLCWLPLWQRRSKTHNELTELLCKTLINESGEKQSVPALHDLEEVDVEFFKDDAIKGCSPLPCKTLSDALAYSGNFTIKVCLRLKWGGNL